MQKILGQALKQERELRGISLEEIAREMHIQVRYLQSLENEDFTYLPPDFYLKYYIKGYLHAIGADENTFFNKHQEYLEQVFSKKQPAPVDQFIEKIQFSKFKKRRLLVIAALFLVAVLVALFTFAKPIVVNLFSGRTSMNDLGLPASTLPVFIPVADFTTDITPVKVTIDVLDTCWIRTEQGSQNVIERTYKKGEKIQVGGYKLRLLIGNPQAVRMIINGREYTALRQKNEPQHLLLTPDTLNGIFQPEPQEGQLP